MNEKQHPILEILEASGITSAKKVLNMSFIEELSVAIAKDGKSVALDKDCLQDNDSYDDDQPEARNVIEDMATMRRAVTLWIAAATNPLLYALNEYALISDMSIDTDDILADGVISFTGDIDKFIAYYNENSLPYLKKVIEEWQHTIAAIKNGDILAKAINDTVNNQW